MVNLTHYTQKTSNWHTFSDLDGHATSPPLLATTHSICRCAGHYQTGQMTIKFSSHNIRGATQNFREFDYTAQTISVPNLRH